MRITEIFYSIQGESSFAGRPCTFIRLTGCNLRCTWCDTEYSFHGGTEMTPSEIMARIIEYGCKLVEFTGGEPLLQRDVFPLIMEILDKGYTVLVETGGSINLSNLDPRAIKILDIKCPSSGMHDKMDFANIDLLTGRDEVKFVVLDRKDYEYARSIIETYNLTVRTNVLFSPVYDRADVRTIAGWILKDKLDARCQIQLHKYIWGPNVRGV